MILYSMVLWFVFLLWAATHFYKIWGQKLATPTSACEECHAVPMYCYYYLFYDYEFILSLIRRWVQDKILGKYKVLCIYIFPGQYQKLCGLVEFGNRGYVLGPKWEIQGCMIYFLKSKVQLVKKNSLFINSPLFCKWSSSLR